MGDGARRTHRIRSAGTDHLHDHAGLPARLRGLRSQGQTCLRGGLMNVASTAPQMKRDWLDWPFFGESHRAFAGALDRFVGGGAIAAIDHEDVDESCRDLVRALGEAGLLNVAVAPLDGDGSAIDSRSVCLARETLAYRDGLSDFAFAMQGLGSGAVAIAGSDEQRRLVLPKVRSGEWLFALPLSRKKAGSDVAAMACSAREDGKGYRLDGEKTWISNGGDAPAFPRSRP